MYSKCCILLLILEKNIEYMCYNLRVIILLLLAPMIFFLCYYLKKLNFNMKKILIISLCISLFIECSQVTLSIIIPNYARTFDTMDLLCNSISGLIGYMLYKFYNRIIVNSIET